MTRRLKIAIVGPDGSLHIRRWVEYCQNLGYQIVFIKRNKSRRIKGVKDIYIPQPCPKFKERDINEEMNILEHVPESLFQNKIGFAGRVKTYRDIINKEKVDIVHGHWLYDYSLNALLGAKNLVPFVQSVWGSDVFIVPFYDKFKFIEMQYILNAADCIVGNSRSLVDTARSLIDWEDKPHYVFKWGIRKEYESKKYDKSRLREKYGYSKDDVLMLSIRGFEPVYNLRTVVQAFKTAKRSHPKLKLLLAGKNYGWESDSWKIREEDGIKVMNYIEHDKIAELMGMSDISISIPYSDSMSNTLSESMAMGLFIITSDLWPIKEYIKNMKNGVIVNPSDLSEVIKAIGMYFNKPFLRNKFKGLNRNIIKNEFSEAQALERIEEIYSSVLP